MLPEEREARAHQVAHEDDARERRGRVDLVAIDDVVEDAEDNDVNAGAEDGGGEDGHDPRYGGVARPAKPEEGEGQQEGAREGHPHAGLGAAFAVVGGRTSEVVAFLEGVEEGGEEGTEGEAEEGEAPFAGGEAVAGWAEDEREGLVEEVDDAVDEAVVDGGAEGDGLGKEEAEGAAKCDGEEGVEALLLVRVGVADVGGGLEALLLHRFADAVGFLVQDDGVAGLREGELRELAICWNLYESGTLWQKRQF